MNGDRRPKRGGTRLNRQILLEFPLRVPNGQGGFTKNWTEPKLVWAEMIPLRGDEALEHQIQRATQIWKVTIRWRDDLTAECRMVFNGKPLAIVGEPVDPDGKRRWLVMTGESGVKT